MQSLDLRLYVSASHCSKQSSQGDINLAHSTARLTGSRAQPRGKRAHSTYVKSEAKGAEMNAVFSTRRPTTLPEIENRL